MDAGFSEKQLVPMTYGVSDDYYRPGPDEETDLDLVAIGQDRGRDYATLFAAIEGTDLTLDLVCRPRTWSGSPSRPTCGCTGSYRTRSTGPCSVEQR